MTRILAILVALLVIAAPVVAATPEQPPAGTVMVVVLTSDGMTWLPYGSATIPPTECAP